MLTRFSTMTGIIISEISASSPISTKIGTMAMMYKTSIMTQG